MMILSKFAQQFGNFTFKYGNIFAPFHDKPFVWGGFAQFSSNLVMVFLSWCSVITACSPAICLRNRLLRPTVVTSHRRSSVAKRCSNMEMSIKTVA